MGVYCSNYLNAYHSSTKQLIPREMIRGLVGIEINKRMTRRNE